MSINPQHEALPILFGDLETSYSTWLTLTNLCNIHCKYCFNYISHCNEHMPSKLAVGILKAQLLALNKDKNETYSVIYFGGEPTLNQDALLGSIDFLLENDVLCRQCLMTNGVFNQKLLDQLINKNIDFQVSFDGVSNNLRFNKNLTKRIANETITTIKKLTDHHEYVTVRATIHADNVNNMSDLVRFCAAYGVSRLQCAPICDFGDAKANLVRQPELHAYMASFEEAIHLASEYGIDMEVKGAAHLQAMTRHKMKIPLVWLPDGQVAMTITYASSAIKGAEKIIIGRYSEEEEAIILYQDKVDKLKSNYQKNRQKYCENCPIRELCSGTVQFTPFATDTFIPERDQYFCQLAVRMVQQFPVVA